MEIFNSLIHYLELGDVARDMRDSLAYRIVAPEVDLPESTHQAFSHALSHLGAVREGFVVSLRTSATHPTELRKLVRAVLIDWERAAQLFGFEFMPEDKIELPHMQLLAFAHSYVTLGVIPSLPPEQVTFPQPRRSYADIHAPRTPGEVLERIEELEVVVSEAESEPLDHIDRHRLRRTYGFFETSAWLVAYHAARFTQKKRQRN